MPLRNDNGPVVETWVRPEEGAEISGPTILPLDRVSEGAHLVPADLGVHVENDVDTADLLPLFDTVSLISVAFPSFADGRGFSIARRLREMGFKGQIRAFGPVIADQYAYLRVCGFDEVETPEKLSNRQPEAQWQQAQNQMTLSYQRGYSGDNGPRNILEARRAARTS
ncbi:MAG: DUF934 domain-containing protein [Pikeienuella sp.]